MRVVSILFKHLEIIHKHPGVGGNHRCVVVNVLAYDIVVNEFELQSQYYVYFQANKFGMI